MRSLIAIVFTALLFSGLACAESKSVISPNIKLITFNNHAQKYAVICMNNTEFLLSTLEGFTGCEPQNQYKSIMNTRDAKPNWSSESVICMINDLDQIVCKYNFPYFTGFENADGKYTFTYKQLVENMKFGLSLEEWVLGTKNTYPPVDLDNSLLQIFNLTPAIPDFTGGGTFRNLRYVSWDGVCAIEIKTDILKCWKFEIEYAPSATVFGDAFYEKGLEGKGGQVKVTPLYVGNQPISKYRFVGSKSAGAWVTNYYMTGTDGKTRQYDFTPNESTGLLGATEIAEDPENPLSDSLTTDDAFDTAKEPYIDAQNNFVAEPAAYENWETGMFKYMYLNYLQRIRVLDFMINDEVLCFIEQINKQPACVQISSGAG